MEMSAQKSFIEGTERYSCGNDPPAGVTAQITGSGEMFTALWYDIGESKMFIDPLGFASSSPSCSSLPESRPASPLIPIAFVVGWCGGSVPPRLDYTPLTAVSIDEHRRGLRSHIVIMERC